MKVTMVNYRSGFIMLEAIATCALVMLTWYVITQCAVQAAALERQVEGRVTALVAASTTLEKLRAGVYPLKNQTVTENGLPVIVSCQQKLYAGVLYVVEVTATSGDHETVRIKTAMVKE